MGVYEPLPASGDATLWLIRSRPGATVPPQVTGTLSSMTQGSDQAVPAIPGAVSADGACAGWTSGRPALSVVDTSDHHSHGARITWVGGMPRPRCITDSIRATEL